MTREEVIKFLINKKLYVDKYSRKIQDKLFDLGFRWEGPEPRKHKLFFPFLYLIDGQIISGSYNAETFNNSIYGDFEQITYQDILSIKIDEKGENIEETSIQKNRCDNIMESVYHRNTSTTWPFDNIHLCLTPD